MNNAINEIKNTLEGTNSRITEAEDRISEVEDRMVEINEAERKKEKRIRRNEDNLRDLWDNVKRSNIRIIGVPEEEDRKTIRFFSFITLSMSCLSLLACKILLKDQLLSHVSPWVYPVWDSMGFLDLGGYFLCHFREVFNYYLPKYFLMAFLFVFFFWDSYD